MVNEKTTPKAPFSKIAFTSILCLTLVTFLGVGWQTWRSHKNIRTFHAQHFWIQELIGTITHLDEVLTMSARMGTITGNFKWEERYLKFEPQLGAAINEVKRLVPAAFILKAVIQTDTANTKLVAMEKRAFELVRQGQKEEASAILSSEEYQGQKQIYAQGMKQVKTSMQDHITDVLNEYRRHEFFTIVTILTVLPVLFFAFIYIILLTRRRYVIEQKLSEDKLEKYGILFDNISDLAYFCDNEGNVLFLNKVFEKFSGHKPEEFIGKSFAPLFDGEDLKKAIDLYSRTLNGENLQQEVCFKDTGILCEYKSIPLRDERGNITGVIGIARDITERKRLEDELKESNKTLEERVTERTEELVKTNKELELFRNLIDQSNDSIFVIDAVTIRFLDVNDKACKTLGYMRKELLNMKVEDIDVMPKQLFLENLEKLKKREYLTVVSEHKRKDDTTFPVEVNIKTVTFKEKSYMIAVARDITERKRVEEILRESEAKYSRLIENLRDNYIFYSHNTNGIFTYISPSITNLLGYTPEEFLTHYSEYMTDSPNNKEVIKHTDLSTSGIKQPPYEVELYHKDGSIRTLKVQEVPVFDNNHNVIAVEGLAEDITLRKKSEEQLRKSSSVVEQSPITVVITDTEGRIEYVNPKFTRLTGYTLEEIVGKTPRILKSGKTSPETYKQLWKTIKSGGEWHGEFCNKKKNGDLYWESTSVSPIKNNEGIITHFVAVKEDITKRKHADEKLAKYQTQLKRLTSALSLAEERERRHIAEELHDRIGQTLTVIKMMLEDIQETQIHTDTDGVLKETRELLDQAIKDTRTLTFELSPPVLYELGFEPAIEWLVDQFKKQHNIAIDFVGDGLTGLGFDPAVEWLVDQFKKQHNITIDFSGGGLTGMLEDDVSFFLFKSVRELLFNVVKHAQAHRIKVTLLKKYNKIRIDIDDDGVGFDFSKTQFSVNDLSGFGLFSIRERMEHFGGNLDVKSKSGQGTCVTLTMPLKQQEGDAGAK